MTDFIDEIIDGITGTENCAVEMAPVPQIKTGNSQSGKLKLLVEQFGAPEICPACGSKLEIDGIDIVCQNQKCPAKLYNIMNLFLKKLKIKNVDVATLEKFKLMEIKDLLAFVPDKKYKIQMKLYSELAAKMFSQPEKDLFYAMNFKGLSETLLAKIVDYYGWDTVRCWASATSAAIDCYNGIIESKPGLPYGIGEITLRKFAQDARQNMQLVKMIASDPRYTGNLLKEKPKTGKKNTGISICFTGALNTMSRTIASEKAAEAGFEVKSGVSKGLTYLVTNDSNSTSSKSRKAKEFGTKVINEETFLKLLSEYTLAGDVDNI